MYKFSIVSYFDENITAKIRNVQRELSLLTGSRGSLNVWEPHITVGSGLLVEEDQFDEFCKKVNKFCQGQSPTIIKTKEYAFMDDWPGVKLGHTPYVVYIKPVDSGSLGTIASFFEEKLKQEYLSWYDQQWPYQPHITVVHKDLNKEGFDKAKAYLKDKLFECEIQINNVCVALEDNDGIWRLFKRFELSNP